MVERWNFLLKWSLFRVTMLFFVGVIWKLGYFFNIFLDQPLRPCKKNMRGKTCLWRFATWALNVAYLIEQWPKPWLVGLSFRGLFHPFFHRDGMMINHYKDPYKPTRMTHGMSAGCQPMTSGCQPMTEKDRILMDWGKPSSLPWEPTASFLLRG